MHNKLGTAGLIVAVVALVAALTGAAFAAGGLTGKQEKQVKKIAKKFAGKPGPAGPAGTPGAKGDPGTPGSNGTNGTNGTNGKNVVVGTATAGECGTGGATVQVAGEAATKRAVCNGGFSEEMESGTTLRGNWNVGQTTPDTNFPMTSVSFLMTYPGATPPTIVLARSIPRDCTTIVDADAKAACEAEQALAADHCEGSVAEPSADPGFLCFYQKIANTQEYSVRSAGPFASFSTQYGGTLILEPKEAAPGEFERLLMWGTWAVTAS